MSKQFAYTRSIEWILNSRHTKLMSDSSVAKIMALCERFDQLSSVAGHSIALGLERHNNAEGRVDCFLRGRQELFKLEGVSYPDWTSSTFSYLKSKQLESYFPDYYHLEFDDHGTTHCLAGIFQNCWPLRSQESSQSLQLLALYLERTTLFVKDSILQSASLQDFIDTFGFPCSFGIMDRRKSFLKIAAQIEAIHIESLTCFLAKHFSDVFNNQSATIAHTVNAMQAYHLDGFIWVNLDLNLETDCFFRRFSFELISHGNTVQKEFTSIHQCLNNFKISEPMIDEVKLATNHLPFGYKRPISPLGSALEAISGWLNHIKICIEESSVTCKTYIGINYQLDTN